MLSVQQNASHKGRSFQVKQLVIISLFHIEELFVLSKDVILIMRK